MTDDEENVRLLADARLKKQRLLTIANGEVPAGCLAQTFICSDCSGVMQIVLDENKTILGIINLRHRT